MRNLERISSAVLFFGPGHALSVLPSGFRCKDPVCKSDECTCTI